MRRLLSVVFVFAVLTAGCGTPVRTGPASTHPSERWERLPEPPLSPRNSAVGVWTGDEVLVVGGDEWACPPNASCVAPGFPPLGDGAAYNPESKTWRVIADAPVPFAWAETAVVGDTVYFWVPGTDRPGTRTAFLGYNAGTDTWAELPWPQPQPAHAGWYRLVAAGDRLVAYPGSDEQGERQDWIFDPASGTWAQLPDDPLSDGFDREMVWAGNRLVLFDREIVPNPGSERPAFTRGAALEVAGGGWERLPDGEVISGGPWFADGNRIVNPTLGSADGGDVNGWGRAYPNGGVFDLAAKAWSELPDPPAEEYPGAAGVLGFDGARFSGYRGRVLDTVAGAWLTVPALDEPDSVTGRTVVAAGSDLFVYGGIDWSGDGRGRLLSDVWVWTTGRRPEPTPVEAGAPEAETGAPAPPAGDEPIKLWLSAEQVPAGAELVAVLVNAGAEEAMFGVAATVDRWDGTAWQPHRFLGMCLDHWNCTGRMLPLDGDHAVQSIGLPATPGRPGPPERFSTAGLDPGWYRVRQVANEGVEASGVFQVTGDALPPAPLTPVDEPALSLHPVLVPASGGSLTISPLVPLAGGAQTLEDVVAATAPLGEVASVERWTGTEWQAGTTLSLTIDRQGGEPYLQRLVDVPALEPGDYRLVRPSEDGPAHTGRFWVVAP